MKKLITPIIIIALAILMLVGCNKNEEHKSNSGKLRVSVTINPLKEFVETIGGDKVEVFSIIPDGSEPHDFEPKTKDFKELSESDIFVYNGLGMEEWINSILDTLKSENILVVNSSNGTETIKTDNKLDPHIWLSLKEATKQAENIKNALIEKDAANSQYYNNNYNELKKNLDNLYNYYKPKFMNLKTKDFVTGHAAFGYLCRDFGLTQKSIEDVYGEGEPTPKQFQDLINYCKENNIRVIFSESKTSPENAETLARDANAKVEQIDSLESKVDGKTYLEAMKDNLDKIVNNLE